jgi:hypothetical protein
VIMASQNEEEITLEENPNQGLPKEPRHNNKGSSTTQVLMFPNIFLLNWEIGKGQFGLV